MSNTKNTPIVRRREFLLQWHLTDSCEMDCGHCYLRSSLKKKPRDSLSRDDCFKVVDSFKEMADYLKFDGLICFTGGNPLLRDNFFDVAQYAKKQGFTIGILGNPSAGLSIELKEKIKSLDIYRFQLSMDGLKENHEMIRGKGSFDLALRGLEGLVAENIPVAVMATATEKNMNDMPLLMKIVAEKGAKVFSFSRLVPIGEGQNLANLMPTPQKYRVFLETMHNAYDNINVIYPNFSMPLKDPLWALLFYEKGMLIPSESKVVRGCSAGINNLCLDVDGTAYSCRRLEIPIGNVKNSSLKDIFLFSEQIEEHRQIEKINGCSSCNLISYCRGCRAVAKAVNGSYFGKDPQCWK